MLRLIALSLALIAPLSAAAQCVGTPFTDYLSLTDRAQLETQASETLYGEGLYWSARKDGVELTILGTMHLPDPRHASIVSQVTPWLAQSDLLLVEATLADQTDMQTYMVQNPDLLVIGEGPTLPEILDEETWAAIQTAAQARGVPSFIAAKMQPWFLSLTLALPLCASGAMMNGEMGLDGLLMDAAANLGVPTAPLEPWEEMFALISSGTFEEQIDALRIGLVDPAIQDAVVVSLIDGYFEGRTAFGWQLSYYIADFLPQMTQEEFDEQMALVVDQLLIQRNRDWIPVIEEAATSNENIFIAFGAAHLIGEEGVLALLAENGWDIAPR